MATLFRPVGLHELELIWDLQFQAFPPRLAHQPMFYPVANREYAQQIASRWNVNDEASGFSGFVTEFTISDTYLRQFEPKTVGARGHVEYWIPAEELANFNREIVNAIHVTDAYFGESFRGYIPDKFALRGKNAVEQLLNLAKVRKYNGVDFLIEVSANRKAVYINSWFWAEHDFTPEGLSQADKQQTVDTLLYAWEVGKIPIRLPSTLGPLKSPS